MILNVKGNAPTQTAKNKVKKPNIKQQKARKKALRNRSAFSSSNVNNYSQINVLPRTRVRFWGVCSKLQLFLSTPKMRERSFESAFGERTTTIFIYLSSSRKLYSGICRSLQNPPTLILFQRKQRVTVKKRQSAIQAAFSQKAKNKETQFKPPSRKKQKNKETQFKPPSRKKQKAKKRNSSYFLAER